MHKSEREKPSQESIPLDESGSSKICELCEIDAKKKINASVYCTNCLHWVCEHCMNSHKKFPALRNHMFTIRAPAKVDHQRTLGTQTEGSEAGALGSSTNDDVENHIGDIYDGDNFNHQITSSAIAPLNVDWVKAYRAYVIDPENNKSPGPVLQCKDVSVPFGQSPNYYYVTSVNTIKKLRACFGAPEDHPLVSMPRYKWKYLALYVYVVQMTDKSQGIYKQTYTQPFLPEDKFPKERIFTANGEDISNLCRQQTVEAVFEQLNMKQFDHLYIA